MKNSKPRLVSGWRNRDASITEPGEPQKPEAANSGEAARVIRQLCTQDPQRAALFESQEFLLVIESIVHLPDREKRITRLANVLSPYAAPTAKRQFHKHRKQPFCDRAMEAAKLLRKAAEIIGTDERPLPGAMHGATPYASDNILLLEIQGDLGNALHQEALALEAAATDSQIDESHVNLMGMNPDNVARAGIKKTESYKAEAGFMARELMEIIPGSVRNRYQIASKLLAHIGVDLDNKKLRALAKRGH